MGRKKFPYKANVVFLMAYFVCSMALFWNSPKNVGYRFGLAVMLVWNCFLAFLPSLFSRHAVSCREAGRRSWLLWAVLWLVFWPNTFYIVTDVAHFTGNTFLREIPYQGTIYAENLGLWAKGAMIAAAILYGALNGIVSELLLESRVVSAANRGKSLLFRAACSLLGETGIYLGRFLRLNSWDVLQPPKIIARLQTVGQDGNFLPGFIGIYAFFIFAALSFAKPLSKEISK